MAGFKDRLAARIARWRRERPWFDHIVRMQEHYGEVKGNLQAGAVTYFAFLSFFPILALAFFVIGYVSRIFPDAEEGLSEALQEVLPGLVGEGPNEISLQSIQDSAGTVGLIGLAGVLYAGLGWLSGMREALLVMFEKPEDDKPNFVIGKSRDLASLVLIGVVMMVSVGVSGVVSRVSTDLLETLHLGAGLAPVLTVLSIVIGIGAGALLFFALFQLLARPDLTRRELWSGALLGAVGFEVLKQLSTFLIASTKSQPAFQAFGIALILVVWINYFSRVVMYAAAWAHTSPTAVARREAAALAAQSEVVEGPAVGTLVRDRTDEQTWPPGALVAAGGVLGLLVARVVRRRD